MIKIEIWSDINCPFCYIGKRHLERALTGESDVEIEWKSFELDPHSKPPKGADQTELLAKKYGRDRVWAEEMNANMTRMAAESGLKFRMSELIPANSFNAHRLIHFAKSLNLQDAMKERLLKARFEEAMDIDDEDTLIKLGVEAGLSGDDVKDVLRSGRFSEDVRNDETMASQLGINGVPFFVINKQYALSGAQPVEAFKEVIEKLRNEGQLLR